MLPLIKGQMSEHCVYVWCVFVWVWVFPLGGPPSAVCLSVSDFLSDSPTICGVPQSGTTTMDVWKATKHFLQVHTHTDRQRERQAKAKRNKLS